MVARGLRSSSGPDAVAALEQRFAACAGWNAGHCLDGGDGEAAVRESLGTACVVGEVPGC